MVEENKSHHPSQSDIYHVYSEVGDEEHVNMYETPDQDNIYDPVAPYEGGLKDFTSLHRLYYYHLSLIWLLYRV